MPQARPPTPTGVPGQPGAAGPASAKAGEAKDEPSSKEAEVERARAYSVWLNSPPPIRGAKSRSVYLIPPLVVLPDFPK
eukprot:5856927-Lingulodinium_polyedra.AAC.1